MNKIVDLVQLHTSLTETKRKVSDMIVRATCLYDDNFARSYGLNISENEQKLVDFDFTSSSISFRVSANDSIQDVCNKMKKIIVNHGLVANYNEAVGIVAANISDGTPVELTIYDDDTEEELIYNPKRYGPMYSFNGRSGQVVSEDGDYTAEMVGALPSDTFIPSKTSELENDSGYVDETALNTAIESAISGIEIDTGVTSFNGRTGAITPASGDYTAEQVGAVPTSTTVNGHALTSNITLSASDVSAVPTTRKINGKPLTSDITLITLGTTDLTAGSSSLASGTLYGVYE